ncbi:S26 family signal peptidase [Enterococcus silesiacus]|uniref:Signal peptidase I n=1 Tax=Enterococcus silesiacus TaxID=332949 RepID=A0A0S3KE27_9ENTE|nr:signal peptidase I [Enterococcus silesiacus]ALS02577.1 S26 family signal peptidase [Enterococcus silesiacus]OJG93502.1 signal peptidase I [Enterococcus silesiacus]
MKKQRPEEIRKRPKRKSPAGYSKKKNQNRTVSKQKSKRLLLEAKSKQTAAGKYHNIQGWVANFFFLFVFLAGIVFLIQVKSHQIDGHSMNPTFNDKDRILVIKGQEPKRYEIITFEPKSAPGDSYVKRVIGLPGDVIWVEGTSLYINYQAENNPANLYGHNLAAKDLPDGTTRITVSECVAKELAPYYQIPENAYFVQGDNRNHSDDSRVLGLIDRKQIEGVVAYRYYPFNKIGVVR